MATILPSSAALTRVETAWRPPAPRESPGDLRRALAQMCLPPGSVNMFPCGGAIHTREQPFFDFGILPSVQTWNDDMDMSHAAHVRPQPHVCAMQLTALSTL